MKILDYFFFLFCIIIIFCAIYFKPVSDLNTTVNPVIQIKESKNIISDLRDKTEDGICMDMYQEGFNWGIQQGYIAWHNEHIGRQNMSKEQRAMLWYEFWEEIMINFD